MPPTGWVRPQARGRPAAPEDLELRADVDRSRADAIEDEVAAIRGRGGCCRERGAVAPDIAGTPEGPGPDAGKLVVDAIGTRPWGDVLLAELRACLPPSDLSDDDATRDRHVGRDLKGIHRRIDDHGRARAFRDQPRPTALTAPGAGATDRQRLAHDDRANAGPRHHESLTGACAPDRALQAPMHAAGIDVPNHAGRRRHRRGGGHRQHDRQERQCRRHGRRSAQCPGVLQDHA